MFSMKLSVISLVEEHSEQRDNSVNNLSKSDSNKETSVTGIECE